MTPGSTLPHALGGARRPETSCFCRCRFKLSAGTSWPRRSSTAVRVPLGLPKARKCPALLAGRNLQQQGASEGQINSGLQETLKSWTSTKLYSWWFSGAVMLVVYGVADAGWSGDWSRLQVLTKDQEAVARQAFTAIALFHLVCTAVATKISADKGLNKFAYPAKVLFVGFPALLEVFYKEAREEA